MPPARTRKRGQNNQASSSQPPSAVDNIASLRRQCADKGLPTHGRKNALVARLQNHSAENANLNSAPPPAELSSALLTEPQLAQIQSIVQRTVEQSVSEIASNAARAAVQAMANSSPNTSNNITGFTADQDEATEIAATTSSSSTSTNAVLLGSSPASNSVPYGNGFHEVPAQYVKQIQSGEFFDISKLLPKNMSIDNHSEEPMILSLENSVIKAKKATQPTSRITNIEQWTTAFTVYTSVMTHQFPGRSQELLSYMSLIRHAAQTHRGLGWCVYDHKFRCKAALNPGLNWSLIDQQLLLMIFTTSPDILVQQYPNFSNGPQNWSSSGGVRGGLCRNFNRGVKCSREPCQYQHLCNTCNGKHPGFNCPSDNPKSGKSDERASKRDHNSSKSRRN